MITVLNGQNYSAEEEAFIKMIEDEVERVNEAYLQLEAKCRLQCKQLRAKYR